MDAIAGLLKIGLLIFSILSLVAYCLRRSDNRSAFKALRASPPLRPLTAEESAALHPFAIGQRAEPEPGVRSLSGAFVRHALHGNGGTSTEHCTLGDVDVLLPYDALGFVTAHNDCEVVLLGKAALVVKLHGFTLEEGRQRTMAAADASDEAAFLSALPEPTALTADARYRAGEVDILGERLESAEEIAERRRGSGRPAAGCCATAFLLLWSASWDLAEPVRLYLLGVGVLMAASALGCLLRVPSARKQPAAAQPVLRMRGMLRRGDSAMWRLPAHWDADRLGLVDKPIEAEVRSTDHRVLGLGTGWSVADEQRRFAHVAWARDLPLAVIGLLAVLGVWLSGTTPRHEAGLALAYLHGPATLRYGSVAELNAQWPALGRRVRLAGTARCELVASAVAGGLPVADCQSARWDGDPLDVRRLALPSEAVRLAERELVEAHDDPQALAVMSMPNAPADDDRAGPLSGPLPRILNLGRALKSIDLACRLELTGCDPLRHDILQLMKDELGDTENAADFADWDSLLESSQEEGRHRTVTVSAATVIRLRGLADEWLNRLTLEGVDALLPDVLAQQRGGVLLRANRALWTARDELARQQAGAEGDPAAAADDYWMAVQRLGARDGPGSFVLSGVVTGEGRSADGARWLGIDVDTLTERGQQALIYTVWWALALALCMFALPMLLWHARAARQRGERLQADMATRPPPGGFNLF